MNIPSNQPLWTVYRITFNGVKDFVIFGSTSSVYKSLYQYHFHNLEEGIHINKELQSLYDKHGFEALRFDEIHKLINSRKEASTIAKDLRLKHKEQLLNPADIARV